MGVVFNCSGLAVVLGLFLIVFGLFWDIFIYYGYFRFSYTARASFDKPPPVRFHIAPVSVRFRSKKNDRTIPVTTVP